RRPRGGARRTRSSRRHRQLAAVPVGDGDDDLDGRCYLGRRAVPVPRPSGAAGVRVAVAGAGAIARTHAGHLAELGHELAAACDPDTDRARALAEPGGGRAYAAVEEMLDTE